MSLREILLAAFLAGASALMSVGVFAISQPAGYIATGGVVALWSWLVFGEIG